MERLKKKQQHKFRGDKYGDPNKLGSGGRGGERQEDDGKIPLESKVKEKKPDLSWNRKVSARPPRDLGLKGMWVRHRQMLSLRSTSPSCKI